jgi:hypothetical protein
LALDISVSALAYAMHYGTFTGVMAAAVAGLMCSSFTMIGRWAIGYSDRTGVHSDVFKLGA